jgi:FMN phosphatase YigB (HAD superfamily)
MKKAKIALWDCDGCLVDTPLPERDKTSWEKHHDKPWPFQGWWGRMESMCADAFNITTFADRHEEFVKLDGEGFEQFILTSRLPRFTDRIKDILSANGLSVKKIFTKTNATKGERILELIAQYKAEGIEIEHIKFFDDRLKEIVTAEAVRPQIEAMGITFDVIQVENDHTVD